MSASVPVKTTASVRGRLRHNVAMARYSTWRAGGNAQTLFQPADIDDLVAFLASQVAGVAVHFIGLGSNLLVRDGGIDGVVVRLAPGLGNLHQVEQEQGCVYAQAGVAAPKLARYAANSGLSGAQFMVGIPGSVGGALAMNAGCFGSETWGIVHSVTLLTPTGELQVVPASEFVIGYRSVVHTTRDQLLFVAANFILSAHDADTTVAMDEVMQRRAALQPIGTANAGSVFANPPAPAPAAGQLIEQAGLAGYAIDDAQVSTKHCNFIINNGKASATQIEELIEHVRATVLARTGIQLCTEVRILGKQA